MNAGHTKEEGALYVVLAAQFYPPETGGCGIAAYMHCVANALVERGHRVCVITRSTSKSKTHLRIGGVEVIRLPHLFESYRWGRIPVVGPHTRSIGDLVYAWRVRKALLLLSRNVRPDIVEYADFEAEGLFHPRISAYAVRLHGTHAALARAGTSVEFRYRTDVIRRLERWTLQRADAVIAPTDWFGSEVCELEGVHRRKVHSIPNPVDVEHFAPKQAESRGSGKRVLYLGRLQPTKGAMVFARAIPRILAEEPSTRFLFVGPDRPGVGNTSHLKEIQAHLGVAGVMHAVEFHGEIPHERCRDFYRSTTVFVMPSFYETFGYTLVEAMACGLPVVASDIGSAREILEDGRLGILFPPGNHDALADEVVGLLRSPQRCARYASMARAAAVEKYSPLGVADRLVDLYRELIINGPTGPFPNSPNSIAGLGS